MQTAYVGSLVTIMILHGIFWAHSVVGGSVDSG